MKGKLNKKNIEINVDSNIANSNIENLMIYLKETYKYDDVSVHNIIKENLAYNSIIFEDALNFICICHYGVAGIEEMRPLRKNLTDYFDSLTIIKLTHIYQYHSVSHYLVITHFFDKNNAHRILIFDKFNAYGLIDVKSVFSDVIPKHKDLNSFYEFKNNCFEAVLEINIDINNSPPILKDCEQIGGQYSYKFNPAAYKRKAQLIIRQYLDGSDHLLSMTLYNNDLILKQGVQKIIDDPLVVNESIDKFLFPLCENEEDLSSWNLKPELCPAFMSQDYTSFWALKKMVEI